MLILVILRFSIALVFAAAGVAAFFGYRPIVEELRAVRLGNGYLYLVASANVAGGVLVLAPPTRVPGAILLSLIAAQAVLIHLLVLKRGLVGPVILLGLVILILLQSIGVIA